MANLKETSEDLAFTVMNQDWDVLTDHDKLSNLIETRLTELIEKAYDCDEVVMEVTKNCNDE